MAKKSSVVPDDCVPKCETCVAGRFEPGEEMGDCRLFPMKWHVINDEFVCSYDPAERGGDCLQYKRKVN